MKISKVKEEKREKCKHGDFNCVICFTETVLGKKKESEGE
jgi:hypothetical protein